MFPLNIFILLLFICISNIALSQTGSGRIVFRNDSSQEFKSIIEIVGFADKYHQYVNNSQTLYYYVQKKFIPFSINSLKTFEIKSYLIDYNSIKECDVLITLKDGKQIQSYYNLLDRVKLYVFDELTGTSKTVEVPFSTGTSLSIKLIIIN